MRNYFNFNLKGQTLFVPFVIGWIILVFFSVFLIVSMLSMPPDPLFGTDYFMSLIVRILFVVCSYAISCFIAFYFVRATLGGLSLSGEKLETDYNPKEYVKLCARGILLTVVTFGIYTPWFWRNLIRYFAKNTSFRSNQFEFQGNGTVLFGYVVLFVMLPVFIFTMCAIMFSAAFVAGSASALFLLFLLFLAMLAMLCLYEVKTVKWLINYTYGEKRIVSNLCGVNAALFLLGQVMLIIVTVGFWYPMAIMRIWRYYVSRMVLGEELVEDKFGFTMDPWKNYLAILLQWFLSVITLGFYLPWAYAKIATILLSQTYVEVIEKPEELMPEEYE